VLALANGTSAAAFRVYNTTDQTGSGTAPTNYERAFFDWTSNSNTLSIGATRGGTGSLRPVTLYVPGNAAAVTIGNPYGAATPNLSITGANDINIVWGTGYWIDWYATNSTSLMALSADAALGWSAATRSSGFVGQNSNVTLYGEGALALANRSSPTSGSGFRIYNTTDQVGTGSGPTNFERAVFDWQTTANTLTIGTQAGGTGTGRSIRIVGGPVVGAALYNFGVAPATKTTAYTVADGDQFLIFNGGASITVTLPAAASYTGRELVMKTIAAFTVISASANVVPRTSATAGTAILAATAGSWALLISDGTNWVIMAGA
jgi:hypothetical protein